MDIPLRKSAAPSSSMLSGRIGPLRENVHLLEWFRFLTERWLIVPAARRLPLSVALATANAAGVVDSWIPTRASRAARAELDATGFTGATLERKIRERLAMTRHDLVWRERMAARLENISRWQVFQSNEAPVHALLDAKTAFIAAGGHFTQAAGDARHLVLPMKGSAVGGAVPRWRLSPFELRRRLDAQADEFSREGLMGLQRGRRRSEALPATVPDLWQRAADWRAAPAAPAVQAQRRYALATPGPGPQKQLDPDGGKPGAFRRPFAGMVDRGFAVGAARIARIAQCPLVPFVAVLSPEPRTIIIDWGDPIPASAVDDKDSDRTVISRAIDFIERGVGRYPEQYLHPIGSARRWDRSREIWVQQRR